MLFLIIFACASCSGGFRHAKEKFAASTDSPKATPTLAQTTTPTIVPTETPAFTHSPVPTMTSVPSANIYQNEALPNFDNLSAAPMPGCSANGFWYTTFGTRSKDANGNDVAVYPNEMPAELKKVADKYNVIYRGDNKTKKIYLTFTAGFVNENVDKIFEILHEKNATAAFFVSGDYLLSSDAVNLKKAYQYGFIIGGHGYWHDALPKTSTEHVFDSIEKNEEELRSIIGSSYKMKYFRPPFGYTCERDIAIAMYKNIKTVFWTFLYNDYDNNGPKKDEALSLMKDAVYPGSIFYLHATSHVTYSCLAEFIDYVRSLGYEFGSIGDLAINH